MTKRECLMYLSILLKHRTATSYKFYLMLSIFELGQKVDRISFASCGREMIIQAWNDLSEEGYHFNKTDKLKGYKSDIMLLTNAPEFCSHEELRRILQTSENEKIISFYSSLTAYCVFLLLSHGQWNDALSGINNYHSINRKIRELSQSESGLYEIYETEIILNSAYFETINKNHQYFFDYVKEELRQYLSK